MHINPAALTLLLTFASSASAFFPLSEAANGIRHATGILSQYLHHDSDVVERRDNQEQQRPNIFISIAPFRSALRYRIRNAPPPPTRSLPYDKRSNEYKIVTASAPSQPTSAAIDEDGTDYSYFSEVQIGSKDTDMYLLLDTGSAVTWVMSDECSSDVCKMHNLFGSSSGSSTLEVSDTTFSLDYGSGQVTGVDANDTISFAGMKVNVPIGLATNVSEDFRNYPFDGILGLGRIPIQSQPPVTFIQEIANNKLLKDNIFGVNLQRNSDGTADGEINFGAPDTSKYEGDLHWVDTTSDHTFWEVAVEDMAVNGKTVGFNGRTAVLDTGTSYMLIPPGDAKTLFGQIPGSSTSDNTYWNVPCDSNQTVQVVIGGVGFDISPKDYVGAQVSKKRDGSCQSHIVGLAAANDATTWLLGDTFLKNVYTVFDADKNRVGFGAKTGSSVVNQGEASQSGDSSNTGTATTASGNSPSSGSSSGSGTANPSMTGLHLPGSTSQAGSSSASTGKPSDTKASAASTSGVEKALIAAMAACLSLVFL